MIIKAYYPGRIDVFDTDHFTEPLPMRGNLLTNYSLEFASALNGKSILLHMFWYETADSYREVTDEDGLPVARRRDGWSFLVADPLDLAELERITVDGEIVLERMGEKLVDAAALMRIYDDAEDLGPRAVAAHSYLDALIGDSGFGDPEDLVSCKMGMSKESYRAVEAAQASIAWRRTRTGDDWAE